MIAGNGNANRSPPGRAMDRNMIEEHLAKAEERVRIGEELIRCQLELPQERGATDIPDGKQ
jgi:hypothetical protein